MKIELLPLEERRIPVRGETVVYLSGTEPLFIQANGKRAEIPTGSQVTFPVFDSLVVQNKGDQTSIFEVLIVEGLFSSLTDGKSVDAHIANPSAISNPVVSRLGELLTANVNNPSSISNPIVSALAQTLTADVNNPSAISNPIVSALAQTLIADVNNPSAISNPIVSALAQTLTADVNNPGAISNPIVSALAQTLAADVNNPSAISDPIVSAVGKTLKASITNVATLTNPIVDALGQTLETLEKPATSLASSSKTFTAGESYEIPANENRRDITVMASESNTDVITVAGIPLRAGQYVELNKYTGAVSTKAVAADDKIFITEVIK